MRAYSKAAGRTVLFSHLPGEGGTRLKHRQRSLLTSHKATEKMEGVFDAREFRQLIDTDVSDDVIKQLQKECGDDLTLGTCSVENSLPILPPSLIIIDLMT